MLIPNEGNVRKFTNNKKDTLFLCIREPTPEIYITTGDIFVEPINKIISTNSVFIDFNRNDRLEYVPGANTIAQPVGIEAVVNVDALTTSMKTRNLLFNLNCVKDFGKMKSLQKGSNGIISEAVKQFINLLTVKIELDPVNRVLNGEFLSELSNLGVIVTSGNDENKPIVDLLKHGDKFLSGNSYTDFVNCSDVYCNAGRNFTKIFRLQKENAKFGKLIEATLAQYNVQVQACKTFFDNHANDPIINQIFSELNKYVLNEIVNF
jgi:hypothetical protein